MCRCPTPLRLAGPRARPPALPKGPVGEGEQRGPRVRVEREGKYMPEQIFYFRGSPDQSPTAMIDSPEVRADLTSVTSLTQEQVSRLSRQLSIPTGYLDPKAINGIVREVVQDSSIAGAVQRVLLNLSQPDVTALLRRLHERVQENPGLMDKGVLDRLSQILPELVKPYPGLLRFRKAERLSRLTGQQLESVELVCDLRPVFDERREHVEGMMPYTHLRIVATGADGLPDSFEAELSHQQVCDLAEKATKAKDKLEVLRRFIQATLPDGLPTIALTRPPKKESSDA